MSTTQNETSGISATVQAALRNSGYGSYFTYATPVVEALTARETDIASSLIDYAVDAGADAEEVKAYMRQVGMVVATEPEEEPEVDDDDDSDTGAMGRIEQAITALTGRIDSLTQFARNNGYRG
jgi:hypothetical protein